jgi:tRNA-splicing ligase RtcB
MAAIRKIHDFLWEVPREGKMRVPARIYIREDMLKDVQADNALQQAVNVACMPGIVNASFAMPDVHWGYGFPIGGVAAFDMDGGVISPGGVGYDINCGVRLMTCRLTRDEIKPHLKTLVNQLFKSIPSGVGAGGKIKSSRPALEDISRRGAAWAVDQGYGSPASLDMIEEQGCIKGADPACVPARAWQRGADQVGTLGSGNHFLEIGCVEDIYDARAAAVMGLAPGQVTIMIHCGSRGFGHQICDDFLAVMDKAVHRYHIDLADRQLACAPLGSPEAHDYYAAMCCAVNYAFANRQVIAHQVQQVMESLFGTDIKIRTVYEVAHNLAKFENHRVDGKSRRLCVHRKGATRAFPAGHPEVPSIYQSIGQPVLIPGDMGRYSYVLTGAAQAMSDTFGSACHGAGRRMSRHAAIQAARSRNIAQELRAKDIFVMAQSRRTLDEEISEAYKDVVDVVDTCAAAGLANKVARILPLGCIKG